MEVDTELRHWDTFSMDRRRAEHLYTSADALFREQKYAEALAVLKSLEGAKDIEADVLFAEASCLGALGRISEAEAICQYLINILGVPRAKKLLADLKAKEATSEPNAGEVVAAEPEVPRADEVVVHLAVEPAAPFPWKWVRVGVLGVVGLVGLAVAWQYQKQLAKRYSYVAPATSAEVRASRQQLDAHRAELREAEVREQAEAERLEQEQREAFREAQIEEMRGPAQAPGQEYPPELWEAIAVDGIPVWKPGRFREVPCVGAPERTIDVYVPMAYQERPEDYFPGLMVSMPGGNPGFLGLIQFAESRDLIMVAINSSTNETYRYNEYAQEVAFATVFPTLRIDQRLCFAIGASGGARTSWECASRHPENFAGLVMIAFGALRDFPIPNRVRVAFLHGDTDFNNPAIAQSVRNLPRQGFQIIERIHPGDHGTPPPLATTIEALDWMIGSARAELGLAHPMEPLM